MSKLNGEIVALCRDFGIDSAGLGSIRNFIDAAFYHSRLPGTLPADKHVLWNTAIRRATNRIACQGRHGNSCAMSRRLSRDAELLRAAIKADGEGRKLPRWLGFVTDEHQEPVREVERWIAERSGLTVDDVILRLLRFPSVVITRQEERRIPGAMRHGGIPSQRYAAAGIEIVRVEEGAAAFFGIRRKASVYDVARQDFE